MTRLNEKLGDFYIQRERSHRTWSRYVKPLGNGREHLPYTKSASKQNRDQLSMWST